MGPRAAVQAVGPLAAPRRADMVARGAFTHPGAAVRVEAVAGLAIETA